MPRDLSVRARRACLTTCVFCPVSEDYSEQATTGAGQGAKKEGEQWRVTEGRQMSFGKVETHLLIHNLRFLAQLATRYFTQEGRNLGYAGAQRPEAVLWLNILAFSTQCGQRAGLNVTKLGR